MYDDYYDDDSDMASILGFCIGAFLVSIITFGYHMATKNHTVDQFDKYQTEGKKLCQERFGEDYTWDGLHFKSSGQEKQNQMCVHRITGVQKRLVID